MTKISKLLALLMFSGAIFLTSCEKDDEDDDPQNNEPNEFVATDGDFSGFASWTLAATLQGPDPALGPAHGGEDSTVVRKVYVKDNASRVNGKFPTGTIIVKESMNPDQSVLVYTAMVKRGNGFSPDYNDWEWFMLAGDGEIMVEDGNEVRGAVLGQCNACHSAAAGQDYVFSAK